LVKFLFEWRFFQTFFIKNRTDQIYYIVEIQNTVSKSGSASQWQSVYTGKETETQTEKLQPGTDYLSRIKARYLNIEGDPSANLLFNTMTGCPDKPLPPDSQYQTPRTRFVKIADTIQMV